MNPTAKSKRLSDTKALEDTPYKMPPTSFDRMMPDFRPESNPVVAVTHEPPPSMMPTSKK